MKAEHVILEKFTAGESHETLSYAWKRCMACLHQSLRWGSAVAESTGQMKEMSFSSALYGFTNQGLSRYFYLTDTQKKNRTKWRDWSGPVHLWPNSITVPGTGPMMPNPLFSCPFPYQNCYFLGIANEARGGETFCWIKFFSSESCIFCLCCVTHRILRKVYNQCKADFMLLSSPGHPEPAWFFVNLPYSVFWITLLSSSLPCSTVPWSPCTTLWIGFHHALSRTRIYFCY